MIVQPERETSIKTAVSNIEKYFFMKIPPLKAVPESPDGCLSGYNESHIFFDGLYNYIILFGFWQIVLTMPVVKSS
jgi:hypothetical protein